MAADKMINIGLSFSADTSKARQELQKLKDDLTRTISTATFDSSKVTSKGLFNDAIKQAEQLRGIIESATDATGNFNLTKFTRGLDSAGYSMKNVSAILGRIGATDVFNDLTKQIANADTRTQILHGTVQKFFTGLKNTAMWTIQSNAIHAVEKALSSAYGYAQQLNKGLTDIAIVSDLSTEQLTAFAKTANQMAKDLSASTKDVVSGALIYYQAGLSDEEVIKRTETTIKLAQTSGESAEQISSYMTAIWNNFYDGSKSIEYYADAISYLGAVTAASNADIAEGMQAFSAVADTVGLSFEYGAAALTTLRDITQQSASTIGNSLKTIFARLSSLKMGEDLEDGVDLTKYTKALADVGVNIIDVNGELKNMDTILDDLASRWDSLSDAQKVGLAQTVGGVRQYNNLISLMDNYERFQELATGAEGSEGYLQKQADIYADSWEGAKNRLQAAWQGIYDQIIDDKFFIKLTNFLTGIVNFISKIIDGAGGLKGVISLIVMAFTSFDPNQTAKGLSNVVDKIKELIDVLDGTQQKLNELRQNEAIGVAIGNLNLEDNSEIYKLTDQLTNLVEKRTRLYSDGDKAGAAAADAAIQRLTNQINTTLRLNDEIDKTTEKYKNFKNAFEEIENVSAINNRYNKIAGASDFNTQRNLMSQTVKNFSDYGLDKDAQERLIKAVLGDSKTWAKVGKQNIEAGLKELKKIADDEFIEFRKSVTQEQMKELLKEEAEIAYANKLDNSKNQKQSDKIIEELGAIQKYIDKIDFKNPQERAEALEQVLKRILKDQDEIDNKKKQINDKFAEAEGQKPNEDKGTPDWASMLTSATQATSAMVAMSSGMEGLWKTAKEGKLSFGSLVGSFGSIWRGTTRATEGLHGLGKLLQDNAGKSELLGGAMTKLGKALGGAGAFSVLGWVLALTAAFGVLKWAMNEAYKASPEGKLEAANKALQEQEQLVNKLTNEYNETITTINKLKDVEDTFKDLTEGTYEWTEALQSNNEAVIDLLDSYGLLSADNYHYLMKNGKLTGVIEINQSALDEIANRAQARLSNARIGTYAAKNAVDEAQLRVDKDNLYSTYSKALTSAGYKMEGPVDSGAGKQFNSGGKTLDHIIAAVNSFDGSIDKFLNQADAAEWGDWISLIESNDSLKSGINNQIAAIDKNTAAIEARNQQIGQNLAANADVPEWAKELLGENYADRYQGMYDEEKAALDKKDLIAIGTSQAYKDELETLGLHYNKTDELIYDENGDEVSVEKVRQMLANEIVRVKLTDPQEIANILYENDGTLKSEYQEAKDEYDSKAEERAIDERYSETLKTAKELGLDSEEFEKYVGYLQEVNVKLKDHKDIAAEVALANMRINRGVETLSKNIDDWTKEIELATDAQYDWQKDGYKYMEAMEGIRGALSDIANVDLSKLDFKFIEQHLDLIKKAATGDEKAINKLIKVIAIDFAKGLEDSEKEITSWEQQLIDTIEKTDFDTIEIGTTIDDGPFNEILHHMVESGAIAADKINEFLARICYTPIVEYKEVEAYNYQHDEGQANGQIRYKDPETGETITAVVEHNEAYNDIHGATKIKLPFIKGSNGKYGTLATGSSMSSALASSTFTGGTGRNVTGGNRSGGGGGGGGHERKKKAKDEDRYHEINQKLKQTEHELDKLNTLKDRSYGRGRLAAMDEEIKMLEREAEQYKELYQEAEHWYSIDKSALLKYGATFNEDGTIANYQAWQASWIDKYNNESISEEEFDAWKKAVDKYEDSLAHLNEAEKKYIETMNKIYDEHLEKVVYRVKYLNELIELSTDYLDYLIKKLDEDMYDTAETVAKMGEKASNILDQIANIQEGIIDALTDENNHPRMTKELIEGYLAGEKDLEEVLKNISQLTDKEQEQLRDWMKQLIDYNEELRQVQKEAYDKIIESVEEFNDKIQRQRDIVEETAGVMQHYANIIDIIGKDTLGISDAMMNALSDLQVTASQASLTIATSELEENKRILAEIQANLEEARERGTESDIKHFEEALEQQEDIVRDLAESWASAYEDALKAAQDAFTNGVKLATEAFDKAVSGSIGSLDKLQDFYSKQSDLKDLFLPDYQRIHDLSKLMRDVNNAINNTDNIKGKERLRNLQEDILKAQQEGTKLSEYDVEFMRKRLELEQAQIALEEARNAKNMVRMTRDNEGNWSYTYTQNPEEIEKAQQAYEDALYNAEKLQQERVKEVLKQMLSNITKFRDEIADSDMSDEEKKNALMEYWQEMINTNGDLLQTALDDGEWLTNTYDILSHNLVDSFEETLLALGSGYTTLDDFMNNFNDATAIMSEETAAQYQKWGDYIHSITEAAGIDFDNFAQRVADDMDLVIAAMIGEDGEGGAVGVAKQLADELGISIDDILEELRTWWDGPEGRSFQMEAEIAENEKIYEQLEKLIASADEIPIELPKISSAVQKISSGGNECGCGATCTTTCWTDCGSNGASQPKGCGCGGNCSTSCKDGCSIGCGSGCGTSCSQGCHGGCSGSAASSCGGCGNQCLGSCQGSCSGTSKKGMLSGGYTGAWGSGGKWELLHEKELVLNKEDTANMLQTVGFVRDLVEMLTTNAGISASGLGNLFAGNVSNANSYLDQNVTIHAEFPNATNHSEIEEAFENLIGLASQYAGRKQ